MQAPDIARVDSGSPPVCRLLDRCGSTATEGAIMTTTRTTISGLDGIPQAVAGLDLRTGDRRRAGGAALAAFTVMLLLLVAF